MSSEEEFLLPNTRGNLPAIIKSPNIFAVVSDLTDSREYPWGKSALLLGLYLLFNANTCYYLNMYVYRHIVYIR